MSDGEKIFKALKLGKVTGLGCTLTSAECDYLIAHDDVLTQYITLLEKEQRWISVSERLPENKFEQVLVCTTYGVSVRLALEIGEAVTHWMPLPEPPVNQLTAHSDIERQDDKSPNDTQTQTIVYGKEGGE